MTSLDPLADAWSQLTAVDRHSRSPREAILELYLAERDRAERCADLLTARTWDGAPVLAGVLALCVRRRAALVHLLHGLRIDPADCTKHSGLDGAIERALARGSIKQIEAALLVACLDERTRVVQRFARARRCGDLHDGVYSQLHTARLKEGAWAQLLTHELRKRGHALEAALDPIDRLWLRRSATRAGTPASTFEEELLERYALECGTALVRHPLVVAWSGWDPIHQALTGYGEELATAVEPMLAGGAPSHGLDPTTQLDDLIWQTYRRVSFAGKRPPGGDGALARIVAAERHLLAQLQQVRGRS